MNRTHSTPFRLTSLLLTVVLLVGMLCVGASAATRENVQHYDTYMCIGDSIAAGYTVSGEEGNYLLTRVPGAYHDIVATAVDAELLQYGWSAFRSVELRYMLEGERHDLDNAWVEVYSALIGDDMLNHFRDGYLDAIKQADLMTINLGSNDVLSYSFVKAISVLSTETDNEAVKAAKEFLEKTGNYGAALVKMLNTAESIGKLPMVLTQLATSFTQSLNNFKKNFDACLKDIYEMNPDVTIVVVGVYNPYNSLKLTENSTQTLGAVVQPSVDLLNLFLQYQSAYAGKYLFAPVDGTETWPMTLDDENFLSRHTWSVHPTVKGHSYMADQILSVLPEDPDAVQEPFPFTDVKTGDWFYDDVYYVWEHGIMQGMSATRFAPSENTTRAQFATVLYRMAGSPAVSAADVAKCPFKDLTADWYKDAVVWAYNEGVVLGTSATTFTPNANITREQLVTMLWRYDGEKTPSGDLSRFADRGSISGYARSAVSWAVDNGIVNGMTATTFVPQGLANRAQLAAILHRYMA